MGRGWKRKRAQAAQRCIRSSPRRQPSQKGAVTSSGSGSGRDGAAGSRQSLARIRALVGTPAPEVTRHKLASRTWLVLVPRTWRTPSRIRLKPWT